MNDFLDELIDERKAGDPEFAAKWPAAELRIRLAALRKRSGKTQEEIARIMHVAQPRVAELEKHPERVSFGRVLKYVEAAGGSLAILPAPEHAE